MRHSPGELLSHCSTSIGYWDCPGGQQQDIDIVGG